MTDQAPPSRDPATRDEVARLESALSLLFPRSRVDGEHAGPESAWINRITIPCGQSAKITITKEIDGWQATFTSEGVAPAPIVHRDRDHLIEVLRDAILAALAHRALVR
jgi:hypothetical protein